MKIYHIIIIIFSFFWFDGFSQSFEWEIFKEYSRKILTIKKSNYISISHSEFELNFSDSVRANSISYYKLGDGNRIESYRIERNNGVINSINYKYSDENRILCITNSHYNISYFFNTKENTLRSYREYFGHGKRELYTESTFQNNRIYSFKRFACNKIISQEKYQYNANGFIECKEIFSNSKAFIKYDYNIEEDFSKETKVLEDNSEYITVHLNRFLNDYYKETFLKEGVIRIVSSYKRRDIEISEEFFLNKNNYTLKSLVERKNDPFGNPLYIKHVIPEKDEINVQVFEYEYGL